MVLLSFGCGFFGVRCFFLRIIFLVNDLEVGWGRALFCEERGSGMWYSPFSALEIRGVVVLQDAMR